MMITESDRIVLIALSAGFLSGSCQSVIEYIIDDDKRHIYHGQKFIAKFLYSSFALSIILGVMTFGLSVWDTSISVAKINRSTVAIAIFLALAPLSDRFWSFIFSQFKRTERKNTTNN